MTKRKKVAKTLSNILEHPVLIDIMDRTAPLEPLMEDVREMWTYDLMNRKPSPAEYNDYGDLTKHTNLDLSTFLFALADRGAVINLPKYKAKRARTITEGQMVVSSDNRHGKVLGLTSNENTFSFGMSILDQNVISTDQVGFPRTYLMTDFDGSLYSGWGKIEFLPSKAENNFLTENKLWDGHTISFKHYVTPEKWLSLYGQYYFLTKALINRMTEERTHLKAEIKRLIKEGIRFPPKIQEKKESYPQSTKEKGDKKIVKCFEVQIDLPQNDTEYAPLDTTQDALVNADKKVTTINRLLKSFRYVTRCIELAAFNMGIDHFPAWMKNVKWEDGFKEKGKRTLWKRLKIMQPGVGQRAIALRCREYEKTEEVAKEQTGWSKLTAGKVY